MVREKGDMQLQTREENRHFTLKRIMKLQRSEEYLFRCMHSHTQAL